jgi:hypothetical protein
MYTYFKKLSKLKTTAETIKIAAVTFELYVWHAERGKKIIKKKIKNSIFSKDSSIFKKEGRKEGKKGGRKEGRNWILKFF